MKKQTQTILILNNKKTIAYFYLMANEEVRDQDANDDNDDDARTCDNEEEDEEIEYDIPDEIYDPFYNYSKCKLIKILLYYTMHQEGHI